MTGTVYVSMVTQYTMKLKHDSCRGDEEGKIWCCWESTPFVWKRKEQSEPDSPWGTYRWMSKTGRTISHSDAEHCNIAWQVDNYWIGWFGLGNIDLQVECTSTVAHFASLAKLRHSAWYIRAAAELQFTFMKVFLLSKWRVTVSGWTKNQLHVHDG